MAKIKISTEPNGFGISPEEREHVFDRFYRIIGTEESGTGLGLSIVKSIADQHHASVQLKDGLQGIGLHVEVTFPATP